MTEDLEYDPDTGHPPLIDGGHDFQSITRLVGRPLERKTTVGWWSVFGIS